MTVTSLELGDLNELQQKLIMKKAVLLSAGIGNRMRPLTNDRTKSLLEVAAMNP